MKLGLIFGLLLAFNISVCLGTPDNNIYEHRRLIFYYEILHHVEQPLTFTTWIEQGQSLFLDRAYYTEWTEPMERFYQASLNGALLPKDAFFGVLIKSHQIQALGLYHFLTKPPAWEFFVQNACWARQHTHPHMFVYAFTRAVLERGWGPEQLPFIYEIIPRHFFDWRFVHAAEQFVPSNWLAATPSPSTSSDSTDWEPWQWWKMLGLSEERWYEERKDILAKNIGEGLLFLHRNPVNAWWRPNDYTRNFPNHREQHSALTYLTEDADWNAYWHLVSVNYSPIIGGFSVNGWRRGLYAEHWMFFLEKFLARYYLERLSNGLGDIPDFKWDRMYKDGYDPELIAVNNQRFVARRADWSPNSNTASVHYLKQVRETLQYIEAIIDAGNYTLRNGTEVNLRETNAFHHILELLCGHTDAKGNFIESHWYSLAHMYLANMARHDNGELDLGTAAHVMLNFETMARDPFFYVFHKEIVKLHHRFLSYLAPYSAAELHTAGVRIVDANASKLATFDDVFDFDVTNLMKTNLTVENGRFIWRENLLARRARLNHRPFALNVTIESDQHREVLLRFYLAPKFDEYGRAIPLDQNRNNFIELANTAMSLRPGINRRQYSYEDLFLRRRKNNYYQSKMYHCATSSNCRGYMTVFAEKSKNCGLHDRLLLPRGWSNGLPMQLFVIANENNAQGAQLWWRPNLFRLGERSLGFPFDRPILNEHDFKGSNMLFKDVKIFHEDSFAPISSGQHKTGEFFYPIFDETDNDETN